MANPRVREIFEAAADLPAEDRPTFLDRACAGDAELRKRVESLLSAVDDAGGFMAEATAIGALTSGSATMADAPREQAGEQLGRYKLLQPIGEGGFGTVWMAEQREPVKRRVALKIIKLGMDTRQVIARFEAERQALAMMDHPNIAKVFDAGSTETGRPYFVMEYIKGVPILEYCDTDKLDTKARLDLFNKVCQAIQHAHQKGIIHRDIKPSNVLVTMHDGVPVPKVIDFGIAKATNTELTQRTLFTEHRQLIGTPAYMSPEQAEMSGLDIDTRSDIYSLGVLLYELLTGTTPFPTSELISKGYAEMMRIIREVEPHKPSTRLSSLGDTGTRTADQRGADVKTLASSLRGDLDWIVMKCLEKDRTRRYETASGLMADIVRHLNDEPVLAGAPSASYKMRKFVKRNRGRVAAVGTVLAVLVLGIIGTTGGMVWAVREKGRANEEAGKARMAATAEGEAKVAAVAEAEAATRARRRAETISAFVTEALRSSDPNHEGGAQDMTVLAAMRSAIQDLGEGRFKDDPEIEAALKDTIATVLLNNGRVDEAEPLFVEAMETRRRLHAGDHADVATSLNDLGMLRSHQGRYADAEGLHAQALEMRERLRPGDDSLVAVSLSNLAAAKAKLRKLEEAEKLAVRSLEMHQRLFKGDHADVAKSLNNVAFLRMELGRSAEAEPLFLQSLEMRRRMVKGDHPDIAGGLSNLAAVRMGMGRLAEAEPLLVQALEMRQRMFKGDHPDVAMGLNNVAYVLRELGRVKESEPYYVQALEMHQRIFKGDHPSVATCLNNVGSVRHILRRPAEAEPMYEQALAMRRRLFPGDHEDVAWSLGALGEARRDMRKYAEAEPLFKEAYEMYSRLMPGDHEETAMNRANLGRVRQVQGKTVEAREDFDASIAMMRKLWPKGNDSLAGALWRSGSARMKSEGPAAALKELEEAVSMGEKVFDAEDPQLKLLKDTLAKCREEAGK